MEATAGTGARGCTEQWGLGMGLGAAAAAADLLQLLDAHLLLHELLLLLLAPLGRFLQLALQCTALPLLSSRAQTSTHRCLLLIILHLIRLYQVAAKLNNRQIMENPPRYQKCTNNAKNVLE